MGDRSQLIHLCCIAVGVATSAILAMIVVEALLHMRMHLVRRDAPLDMQRWSPIARPEWSLRARGARRIRASPALGGLCVWAALGGSAQTRNCHLAWHTCVGIDPHGGATLGVVRAGRWRP